MHPSPPLLVQTSIGKELRQFLDMPDQMKIGYSVFVSALLHAANV